MMKFVTFPYLLTLAEAEHSSAWYMEEKICLLIAPGIL